LHGDTADRIYGFINTVDQEARHARSISSGIDPRLDAMTGVPLHGNDFRFERRIPNRASAIRELLEVSEKLKMEVLSRRGTGVVARRLGWIVEHHSSVPVAGRGNDARRPRSVSAKLRQFSHRSSNRWSSSSPDRQKNGR